MTSTTMACEDLAREALEPCPFCGGKAKLGHVRDGARVSCQAVGCLALGPPEFHGRLDQPSAQDRAIAAWNRRARTAYDALVGESDELPMEMDPFGWARRHAPENLPANARHEPHPDDVAVDAFALAMKAKLAEARAKGKSGWQDPEDCSQQFLSDQLRSHALKYDPLDVANFAMFLHQRGEPIASLVSTHTAAGAGPVRDATDAMIEAGLQVDMTNEDEVAFLHNVWHAMVAAHPAGAGPVGEAVETIAAALWKEEAREGTPRSVYEGRTLEAFREQSPETIYRWTRFARAAHAAGPVEEPGEVERLTRERDEAQRFAQRSSELHRREMRRAETAEAALAEARERLEKVEAAARRAMAIYQDDMSDDVPADMFMALHSALSRAAQEAGR